MNTKTLESGMTLNELKVKHAEKPCGIFLPMSDNGEETLHCKKCGELEYHHDHPKADPIAAEFARLERVRAEAKATPGTWLENGAANAPLVAAAPALLAALKLCLETAQLTPLTPNAIRQVRDAINAAEGRAE